MRRGKKLAPGGVTLASMLLLLLPVTMWGGTFEAPAIVQADETGAFSFEVIYTPGPRECFDYESVLNISNTDVGAYFGDGFCQIPLDYCVPYSVGLIPPISGSLLDPTAVGIVEINFSAGCPYICVPTPTPTPTPTPVPLTTPTPTPDPGCPTDPGGSFSVQVHIIPFGSVGCLDNGDCTPGEFCETEPGACDGIGLCAQRPEVCPDLFDPVCGCDGYSYANSCFAAQVGVAVDYLGECEAPTPTPTPTVTPTPTPTPAKKVTLCHLGMQTISVSSSAVLAHIGHGDTLGPCPL